MKYINEKISGISLYGDCQLLRNLIIVIGVVAVWNAVWSVLTLYLQLNTALVSSIMAITIGMFLLFSPELSLSYHKKSV